MVILAKDSATNSVVKAFDFAKSSYGFYVAATSKYSKAKTLSIGELRTKRLVYMANSFAGHRQSLYDVLLNIGLVNNAISVDSHEIAREFAMQGSGIAVLPNILAAPYLKEKVLMKINVQGVIKTLGQHEIVAIVRPEDLERRNVAFIVNKYVRKRKALRI